MRFPNAFRRLLIIALIALFPCMARGAGWRPLGPVGADIRGIATDSLDPSLVYALRGGSPAELLRSTDAGITWAVREPGLQLGGSTLVVTRPGALEVGSSGSGIARSIDRGETWTTHNAGLASLQIRSLAASATTGVTYASTPVGIFKASIPGGAWSSIGPAGAPEESIYGLATDAGGTTVFASGAGVIYRSIDGGTTWTSVPVPEFSTASPNPFALDPTAPGVAYAASVDSLYKSVNNGVTWGRIFQLQGLVSFICLAVDPLHPQIVFAGGGSTSSGVGSIYRSADGGVSWSRTDTGLPNIYVTSLAFSSDGTRLYAGTSNSLIGGAGVWLYYDAAGPCVAGPTQLCLLGGRFRATVSATDPRTGTSATGQAIPQTDRYGMFSLPDFTGDATFPEVILKMADATAAPPPFGGSFWVFHTGLTDLQYTLTIEDLVKGVSRIYQNDRSDPTHLCGGADTAAFVN